MDQEVVIITGASSGIGEACARVFAKDGYAVVIAARNIDKLNLLKNELIRENHNVIAVKADLSVENDCKQLIEETINQFGRIDVLINNAGISMRALFNDLDLKVIKQVMDINFWGMVYCTKYALPHILKQKGSVVGVSSVAGFVGLPGRTGYSASKFAMHGFLNALRIENFKNDLHVGIIAPGYTASNIRNTALNSLGKSQAESPFDESKLMTAEAVAKEVLKCVLYRKRLVILTAKGKMAYFLSKFFPAIADSLVYNSVKKEKDSPKM
ncbi:MAG: SDR family oxidoreductase [Bacteroidia bacterium]